MAVMNIREAIVRTLHEEVDVVEHILERRLGAPTHLYFVQPTRDFARFMGGGGQCHQREQCRNCKMLGHVDHLLL